MSTGETDLKILLSTMSPVLVDGHFVFLTLKDAVYGDRAELSPIAFFLEEEGMTLVVPKRVADEHGLEYVGVYRQISLQVHSSLEAVGLTAAFANCLGDVGISANVIAAFYHDHIFVSREDADRAMHALRSLAAG